MFREKRKNLVDNAEFFIRNNWYIQRFGISDNIICIVLRIVHFIVPIFTGLILLFGTKFWFFIVILINIIIFFLYFMFEGCILSSLEHRFTTDEFTVIDPFLMLINVDLTKENREKYTLLSNIFMCPIMVIIYYMRFGYIENTELTVL